jgi:molybdopterin converting factor small subunit
MLHPQSPAQLANSSPTRSTATSPSPHPFIMPSITILYFASIRTHLGLERETIDLPLTTSGSSCISDLPAAVYRLHPSEKTKQILQGCMWSVDEEMVDLEDEEEGKRMLKGGETVAVIPPVSGG